MSIDETATVSVKYEFRDGYHIFTSDDVYGLYVASKDPDKAFSHVAASIEKLIKLNDGIDMQVVPTRSYREFVKHLTGEADTAAPAVVNASRTFLVASYA